MIAGTFFKVDRDSIPEKGQVLFRYLRVSWKDKAKNTDDEHHYPVYAVLTVHAIDFYYHGPDKSGSHHQHNRLLHLPLSLNLAVKDNLTSRLRNAYKANADINENYKMAKSPGLCYASLSCFKVNDTGNIGSGKLFLRYLILDFLYDLEHSQVFNASPHIEDIEVRLRENFFFSAIAAKASYFYNRVYYSEKYTSDIEQELYGHNLIEAEVSWLKIIRDERAVEAFWGSDWFRKVEKEYQDVLFSDFDRAKWREHICGEMSKDKDSQNIRILRESTRWFLRRYDMLSSFRSVLQYKNNRKYGLWVAAVFSFLFFPLYLQEIAPKEDGLNIVALAIYLLLGFIPFLLLFLVLLYRRMFLPIIGAMLPRLLMATASSWLFFTTTEELWKSDFDLKLNEIFWIFILLLLPIVSFMAVEIRNQAPDIPSTALGGRISQVLLIGLIYSFIIGLFFTNLTGEKILVRSGYLTEFYKKNLNSGLFDSKKKVVTTALALGLMNGSDETLVNYMGKEELQKEMMEKQWMINQNSEKFDNITFLAKLAYMDDKVNPIDDYADNKWIEIILKADPAGAYDKLSLFTYSLFSKNIQLKYDVPVVLWPGQSAGMVVVFPGMLIFRAVFALFMGIFVQLIFEDKPITEPL